MPEPFRIRYSRQTQEWIPRDDALFGMVSMSGVSDRSLAVQGLFDAIESTLPGVYELDDTVTLYDAKQEAFQKINERTVELVELGFEYQQQRFACTQIAQTRYLGMHAFRQYITYPLSLSTIDDMTTVEMTDEADVVQFCAACVAHVRAATDSGMALKELVRSKTEHTELDTFQDTRVVE